MRLVGGAAGHRVVLTGREPEVRRFDAQRGVIRNEARWRDFALSDCSPDDAVIGHGRVEPMVLEALPVEDRSLDAAVACLVLHHVAEPPAVLREIARAQHQLRARDVDAGRDRDAR